MKKILLIFITVLTVISSLLLFASARNEGSYFQVLEFQQTNKAYPIMNGLENAIGFGEYYGTKNFSFDVFPDQYNEFILSIIMRNGNITIEEFRLEGNYPTYSYSVSNPQNYNDIAICNIDGYCYIVGSTNDGYEIIVKYNTLNEFGTDVFNYSVYKSDMREGYYVEFPFNAIDDMEKPLVKNLMEGAALFVSGMGPAFGNAFTSLFMTDGHLNALAVVLLCFFGLTLGYGVVRFITGLFRKET